MRKNWRRAKVMKVPPNFANQPAGALDATALGKYGPFALQKLTAHAALVWESETHYYWLQAGHLFQQFFIGELLPKMARIASPAQNACTPWLETPVWGEREILALRSFTWVAKGRVRLRSVGGGS